MVGQEPVLSRFGRKKNKRSDSGFLEIKSILVRPTPTEDFLSIQGAASFPILLPCFPPSAFWPHVVRLSLWDVSFEQSF